MVYLETEELYEGPLAAYLVLDGLGTELDRGLGLLGTPKELPVGLGFVLELHFLLQL